MSCASTILSDYQCAQLGQITPINTLPVSIYSLSTVNMAKITIINVANVTALDTTYSIFLDQTGENYAVETALFYVVKIKASSVVLIEPSTGLTMDFAGGNLAVQSGTANALTFTVFGGEA